MKKIYLIVGAILWGGIVDAQTLSVEQYRQKVLEYNQDIQKSQQAVNGALYSLKGIKTGFFPKLDITGNYSYQLEKVEFLPGTDLKHDNYGVEAGLVQNVYSGSAVRKQYDVAKLQHAIAQLSVEHTVDNIIYAVDARKSLPAADIAKLTWLFSEAKQLDAEVLNGIFIGPRREMITPWSTNAVEITQNMGLEGIARIEEFEVVKSEDAPYDPMLRRMYRSIDQDIFTIRKQPDPVIYIDDIAAYNQQEGLALSDEEMAYLNELSRRIGSKLIDS